MRFVDIWTEEVPLWNLQKDPESRVNVGDLGRRKVQLSLQIVFEPKHAIFQRAMSLCGPCELAEISKVEGLSAVPSTLYPQSQ